MSSNYRNVSKDKKSRDIGKLPLANSTSIKSPSIGAPSVSRPSVRDSNVDPVKRVDFVYDDDDNDDD